MLALGRASRTKTDLLEALVLQARDPLGARCTSGFSLPQASSELPMPRSCMPGTCLALCFGAVGPHPGPLQLLPLPLPTVRTFEVPEDFEERLEHQHIGCTTKLLTQTDFPLQAYEPKVQVPYLVLPGQCPRKIEIER